MTENKIPEISDKLILLILLGFFLKLPLFQSSFAAKALTSTQYPPLNLDEQKYCIAPFLRLF